MTDHHDFDVVVFFSEGNEHGEQEDRELELVSTFLPDILKELLMLQALNKED